MWGRGDLRLAGWRVGFHLVALPLSWLSGVSLGIGGIDPVALAGRTVLLESAAGVAVASSRLVGSRQAGRGMVVGRPGGLGLAGTWRCYCTVALLGGGPGVGIGCWVNRQLGVIVSGIVEPHGPGRLLGQRGLGLELRSVVGRAGLVRLVRVACLVLRPAVAAGFQGRGIGWMNWSSGS